MSIISWILVISWVTINHLVASIQDTQEHRQALYVLQSQIEQLRTLPSDSLLAIKDTVHADTNLSTPFCLKSASGGSTVVPFTDLDSISPNNDDDFSKYPSDCANNQTFFNISGVYDKATKVYTFSARWDGIHGGRNQVQLLYVFEPPAVAAATAPGGGATPPPEATASCTLSPDPNKINNANFEHGDNGFTSGLPFRGVNTYPDDNGYNPGDGTQHPLGGYSTWTGGDVRIAYDGGFGTGDGPAPYTVWGQPLGTNTVSGQTGIDSYFYSNPIQPAGPAKPPDSINPNSTYKGVIWEQDVNITGTLPKPTEYEFAMFVSNIKLPVPGHATGKDPYIELKVTDNNNQVLLDYPGPGGLQIPHLPVGNNTAASAWHDPITQIFYTKTTSTSLKMQILDQSGAEEDDDFTMTGLGLYRCS